jgi:hypothetical protein
MENAESKKSEEAEKKAKKEGKKIQLVRKLAGYARAAAVALGAILSINEAIDKRSE